MKEPLLRYILKHLYYEESDGYACTGTAKLIIEEVKNRFGVAAHAFDLDVYEDTGHTYVIVDGQQEDDIAMNQLSSIGLLTVGQVRLGLDITDELLRTDINNCRL